MDTRKATADRLFAAQIRALGRCEAQGFELECFGRLECAHWISRRYSWTRTHPQNAFCLCLSHHRWFTNHPLLFHEWAIGMRGEEVYERLRVQSLRTDKFNWSPE